MTQLKKTLKKYMEYFPVKITYRKTVYGHIQTDATHLKKVLTSFIRTSQVLKIHTHSDTHEQAF